MKKEIRELKSLVGSRIFSVVFRKKDGSLREMTCRFGVTAHLKGGELSYNPDDFNYLTVFDMQKEAYRTINLDTLRQIKIDGVVYDL